MNKYLLTVIMLTASLGRIQYADHIETWYNLPMQKVLEYRESEGYVIDYWERKDGCKMNGRFIIVATSEEIPIGTIVETSKGLGIELKREYFLQAKKNLMTLDDEDKQMDFTQYYGIQV